MIANMKEKKVKMDGNDGTWSFLNMYALVNAFCTFQNNSISIIFGGKS